MLSHILAISLWLLATGQVNSTNLDNYPNQTEPLKIALPELTIEGNTSGLFTQIMTTAGVSGGIVRIHQDCVHGSTKPLAIPAGTTLGQALDDLTRNDSDLEVQTRDGVVDILPRGQMPPLLKVRIQTFRWNKTASLNETVQQLLRLPEVSRQIDGLGLRELGYEGGLTAVCIRDCPKKPEAGVPPPPTFVEETNEILLTALNRIVEKHGHAVWNYSEYRNCDNNSVQFSLLTATN